MTEQTPSDPNPPPRTLWIDATHGVAGDMLLGALIDAGVPVGTIQAAVDAVIPGAVRIATSATTRAGMRATHAKVELLAPDQPHRGWHTIDHLIAAADLDRTTKDRARATFRRLGEVESRAHGIPLSEVHFHEVGAWDSIADIVGVCAALTHLTVTDVVASPVALGDGTVRMAHGELAVPGPAVVDLALGWPTLPGPTDSGELTTPTGMALLRLGTPGPLPALTPTAVGTGAGTKDFPGHANVTRVVVGVAAEGTPAPTPGAVETPSEHGARMMLECTIDDLDPRLWPAILDRLVDAGADDAWLIPTLMRKGRPGHVLQLTARPDLADDLRALIYRHTTTLGIRSWEIHRDALDRDFRTIEVEGQTIRIKQGWHEGELVTSQPEYADVAAAAAALGLPELEILRRAGSTNPQPDAAI
ncbi:nickel pincer cofactor biosynthesis protein LarC [Ammonicoccus fulvus]|uniref:Pyridinium-3,5-bisthiocarboxylic acid mononucleotide nickel insertion protein n=1 Tax=Ammonicoccus fulvus TaxID=3138240 RepID=A0ABZ3FL97_9ACTN